MISRHQLACALIGGCLPRSPVEQLSYPILRAKARDFTCDKDERLSEDQGILRLRATSGRPSGLMERG